MWDLPRPGLEPVFPALAGRFLTTAPPGKPYRIFLLLLHCRSSFYILSLYILMPNQIYALQILVPFCGLSSVFFFPPLKIVFISGLSSLLHWSLCLSLCQYHSFDSCSFMVNFEIRKYESSTFFPFQDCFGHKSPLRFLMNFRMKNKKHLLGFG